MKREGTFIQFCRGTPSFQNLHVTFFLYLDQSNNLKITILCDVKISKYLKFSIFYISIYVRCTCTLTSRRGGGAHTPERLHASQGPLVRACMQEQTNGYQQNNVQLLPGLRQSGQDLRWRPCCAGPEAAADGPKHAGGAWLRTSVGVEGLVAGRALLSVAAATTRKRSDSHGTAHCLVHRSVSIYCASLVVTSPSVEP
jgi:hypothetical protein